MTNFGGGYRDIPTPADQILLGMRTRRPLWR